jgi:rubrerythrin
MKIHITQAGKVIVICFMIGGAIFFMLGGASIISKLVENHRVHSYPQIEGTFKNSDISYQDWDTLKSAFTAHHKKISDDLDGLNTLKEKKYPNNEELCELIKNYKSYLDSMDNASFECPEHINSGTEQRSKKCSCCGGDGTHAIFWKCDECNGTGKIYYNVSITQNCPHCGAIYKSQISAQSLWQ